MSINAKPIHTAVHELESNLSTVARVSEWAQLMEYSSTKKFSRAFLRWYGVRPQVFLKYVRLKSIINTLRSERELTHFKIARSHSLPDEKALNSFTKYHLECPPSVLKFLPEERLIALLENLGSEIWE